MTINTTATIISAGILAVSVTGTLLYKVWSLRIKLKRIGRAKDHLSRQLSRQYEHLTGRAESLDRDMKFYRNDAKLLRTELRGIKSAAEEARKRDEEQVEEIGRVIEL